jgi:hypothetical protein
MPISGKLEVTIKISELPADVTTNKNGWKEFRIDCEGRPVAVALRPRMWTRITDAAAAWPEWVAAISGRMGAPLGQGFVLIEPAVQVFERKPRPPEGAPPAAS